MPGVAHLVALVGSGHGRLLHLQSIDSGAHRKQLVTRDRRDIRFRQALRARAVVNHAVRALHRVAAIGIIQVHRVDLARRLVLQRVPVRHWRLIFMRRKLPLIARIDLELWLWGQAEIRLNANIMHTPLLSILSLLEAFVFYRFLLLRDDQVNALPHMAFLRSQARELYDGGFCFESVGNYRSLLAQFLLVIY